MSPKRFSGPEEKASERQPNQVCEKTSDCLAALTGNAYPAREASRTTCGQARERQRQRERERERGRERERDREREREKERVKERESEREREREHDFTSKHLQIHPSEQRQSLNCQSRVRRRQHAIAEKDRVVAGPRELAIAPKLPSGLQH